MPEQQESTRGAPQDPAAGLLARLVAGMKAAGVSQESIAAHLADLARIRAWLGAPLWRITAQEADRYFGEELAEQDYPVRLARAEALSRYFAFLAGPDGELLRARENTAVRCPLDALNWPGPARPRPAPAREPQPALAGAARSG